ncbi:MAG: hypothetical protein H3Z53_06405 [archaeon]|nr:hypothetical protein [archaeon]MCP8322199.1 hypothetical protein [archaeon]
MTKRKFIIDDGRESITVEGYEHRNVAVRYLMKRRRSLLMTKDPKKVEELFAQLPLKIKIVGKQITKTYDIKWERIGTEEFSGARFVFTIEESKTA